MANDFLNEDTNVSEEGFASHLGRKLKWMGKTVDTFTGFGGGTITEQITNPVGAGASIVSGGLVAAGAALEAVDQIQHGNITKAVKLTVTGAVEAAVTFLNGATLGFANLASLAFTGSYLATNAAKVTGAVLDGLDGTIKRNSISSTPAAVAFPQYGMAQAVPAGAPAGVYGPQTARLMEAGYGQRTAGAQWQNSLPAGQNSVTQGV